MALDLPAWFDAYRDSQVEAIDEVVDAFRSGNRVVVVDAPTGSGKTLIAESTRQRLGSRAAYVCTSKSLQDQFCHDYPYAALLKGRNNYPTELFPERFGWEWDSISADDCTKSVTSDKSCKYCSSPASCPYEVAKEEAIASPLAVLNSSYFLTEANYIGRLSGRGLVIADECDLLDEAVTGFVTVTISPSRVKKLEIGTPRRVTVEESWKEWVEAATPIVKEKSRQARIRARSNPNPGTVREANYLSGLVKKLTSLGSGLEMGGWVYTGDKEQVEFKPVWADNVAQESLWTHGKNWLLMSATVISAESLLSDLGWQDRFYTVAVPSSFPAENRPIFYRPVANMRAADKEEEWPKLVPAIKQILDDNPGKRVLIHSVSYELTRFLRAGLGEGVTYTRAGDREAAIRDFKSGVSRILLAPSLERGVDLPGRLCEVQIIVKVPFRYLGDKQVNKRLYGSGKARGQLWYTTDAIRTLVQMCGRGVRSETDTCDTYILDQQFEHKLWGANRRLFPAYWREALKWRA